MCSCKMASYLRACIFYICGLCCLEYLICSLLLPSPHSALCFSHPSMLPCTRLIGGFPALHNTPWCLLSLGLPSAPPPPPLPPPKKKKKQSLRQAVVYRYFIGWMIPGSRREDVREKKEGNTTVSCHGCLELNFARTPPECTECLPGRST